MRVIYKLPIVTLFPYCNLPSASQLSFADYLEGEYGKDVKTNYLQVVCSVKNWGKMGGAIARSVK
jgi:hypothetical protein